MPGFDEEFPIIFGELDDENLTNIQKLMLVWLSEVQEVEYCLQQLLTMRFVDTAVGAQLDDIGRIVGQARDGLDDETYRRYVRARVAANRSKGTIADALKVADLATWDDDAYIVLDNQGAAAFVVRIEDVVTTADAANATIDLLGDAAAAGVRVILESSSEDPDEWFAFDGGPGFDDDGAFIGARSS